MLLMVLTRPVLSRLLTRLASDLEKRMRAETHIPVLFNETMDALAVAKGGRYIDGTLGRAGHTRGILDRGGLVLGIDRDNAALEQVASMKLENLTAIHGRHGDIAKIAAENDWTPVNGVLLDLGVSSPQLDNADRGFSFMKEGPLDMRMDTSSPLSANDVVNKYDADELCRIFRDLGEESKARQIAKAIAKARDEGVKFETTSGLADFIGKIIPRRGAARHPATRVFQALRMAVNDEIGELKRALEGALAVLKPGGRLVVITFESITDRIVKQFFAAHVGKMEALQQGGAAWRGELPRAQFVFKGSIAASARETQSNPRSRSAKIRAIEKKEVQDGKEP